MFQFTQFEQRKAILVEATEEENKLVLSGLKLFGIKDDRVHNIQRVGALEVNSKNMCIDIDGDKYYIKITSNQSLDEKLGILNKAGVSEETFPRFLKCQGDTYGAHLRRDKFAYLSRSAGESFIRGSKDEIVNVAGRLDGLGRLSSSESLYFIGTWEVGSSWAELRRYLEEVTDCGPQNIVSIDGTLGVKLAEYRKMLRVAFKQADSLRAGEEGHGASHFDLHPLNIVTSKSGECCLLDIDSLLVGPKELAWAYFLFRMARKRICTDGSDSESISRIACDLTIGGRPDLKEAIPFARKEVLRRLSKVLRLNIEHGVTKWNRAAVILVQNIEECNFIEQSLAV